MTTLETIEKLGMNPTDKICAFCLKTTDRWNSFCGICKEYKGLMSVSDFIDYYGADDLL